MLGRSVLSYTGGCTSLFHPVDPIFNEERRWKGIRRKKKKINAFSTLAACVHITLNSSLGVSKVLFFIFFRSVREGRKP